MRTSYPCPSGPSTLADAKARLNIHGLWRHFGFDGEPKATCRSPFRDDHKPSFSVNADGTLWNDFATGEAGDAVDFFQRASGLSQKDACRKYIELAGGHITTAPRTARPRRSEAKPKPVFPDFHTGTAADIQHLASLRNIGREGLEFASERGLLWFATLKNCPAWIVTDSARVNAQARRMDGQMWKHIGAKAWTLPGRGHRGPLASWNQKTSRPSPYAKAGRICWRHFILSFVKTAKRLARLWRCWGHHTRSTRTPCPCSPASAFASSAMMMKRAGARWNAGPRNWHP